MLQVSSPNRPPMKTQTGNKVSHKFSTYMANKTGT